MNVIMSFSIGPYHAARHLAFSKVEPETVLVELSSQEKKYPWRNMAENSGLQVRTLFPGEEREALTFKQSVKRVISTLDELKPEVIVSVSYAHPVMRAASFWAKQNRAISICETDSWAGDKRRFFPLELAKGIYSRVLFDGMFVSGTRTTSYFANMGFPEEKIWRGRNIVDNAYFERESEKVRKNIDFYRDQLSLPQKYFICTARLSPEKNLLRLMAAFARYRHEGGSWSLVIVGGGPQEDEIKKFVCANQIDSVIFAGWQDYSMMSKYYGLASCLILPSLSEPWGLAVNEAMACGLPVILSNKCGCVPELCWKGVNGYVIDPFNIDNLVKSMQIITSREDDVQEMGKVSRSIISNLTPENCALSLKNCIQTLKNNR